MHRKICVIVESVAVSLMLASRMSAQPHPVAVVGPLMASARIGVTPLSANSFPANASSFGTGSTDSRSVGLAVGLSVVIPGAGSLYAGHARHGIIHMAVAAASVLTIAGAAASCGVWLSVESECASEERAVGVAAAGYVVNYVWSIISAVHDAQAYNRRAHASP